MRSYLLAAIAGLFLFAAGTAQAAPSVTGTFNLPDTPGEAALGPDGNVWVAISSMDPDFAKVAPDGTVTPYTATDASISNVKGITLGPDGNMWATMSGAVVKFSVTDPAAAVKTNNGNIVGPERIVSGPDGNLWTSSADKVFRFSPASPATPQFTTVTGMSARGTTAGTDGKIYVADAGLGRVIQLTTAGVATPIPLPQNGMVQEVVGGPNGQVAYTNPGSNPESMGLINAGVPATPTAFPTPPDPFGITFGQDGAYWIAQFATENVGRYTTTGEYSTLGSFPTGSGPRHITVGSGNTIWVTLELTKKIARISGVENHDTGPPAYAKLALTNKAFKVGTKKTALVAKSKKKTPTGTTLSYTLSENATTSILVERAVAGRKSGKSCVKPTAKLKKAKKCTRYAPLKTLTRLQVAGPNKVAFSGRIDKTKLKPGKYRFSITGKDARGNTSAPVTKSFTILKK